MELQCHIICNRYEPFMLLLLANADLFLPYDYPLQTCDVMIVSKPEVVRLDTVFLMLHFVGSVSFVGA